MGKNDPESQMEEKPLKLEDLAEPTCCCCVCPKPDIRVRKLTCCGFIPIKLGIVFIGLFTLVVAVWFELEVFWTLLNEYTEWWYFFVCFWLLLPLPIGCCFIFMWFGGDDKKSRSFLYAACILNITGLSLLAAWNAIYYSFLY